MKLRSAFLSAPAVAGFALLALVVGTIFGVRSAMDDPDDTQVAGTVIERSEEPEVTEEPTTPIDPPVIVRPRPTRPARTEAPDPVDTTPVAPAEEPEQPVGLIPDTDGPSAPVDEEPAAQPDNEPAPRPEPDPEPTRRPRPRPQPEPSPKPEPTPEPTPDPARFALQPGEGHSQDTALAEDPGNSGKYNWEFKSVVMHGGTQEQRASRGAANRITALFSEETINATEPERDFRCDALIDAGSRRLVTDAQHEFVISLWTSDGYSPVKLVNFVVLRQALDLAPGEHATLLGNTVPALDAADDVDYTCRVEYRERQS